MFADYRVPQILRFMGILIIASPEAKRILEEQQLVLHDSDLEIEIRGNSIHSVEVSFSLSHLTIFFVPPS